MRGDLRRRQGQRSINPRGEANVLTALRGMAIHVVLTPRRARCAKGALDDEVRTRLRDALYKRLYDVRA